MNDEQKAKLTERLATLGLEYTAVFVPQSASRNSAEKTPSLNWRVTVRRTRPGYPPGSPMVETIATDYMQGIGHVPKDPRAKFNTHSVAQDNYERECASTGRYAGGDIPPPALADVLYSLLLDGSAADETFDEWCANYGLDTDSRKAEATYNECRAIGRNLQRMFTAPELERLRELFQDY